MDQEEAGILTALALNPCAGPPMERAEQPTMMTLDEIKQTLRAEKAFLADEYGVTEIGVFGSYVRGEQDPKSDIDVLVELERPPRISLLGLVDLQYYLGDLLGIEVDVAIRRNLKKRIGRRILSEVVYV
jgi:predicted nucleotidyltransferase